MRFDELFVHEQRVKRTSFVVKFLVAVVSCICLVTYSLAASTETHASRLALGWITLGSQIIISGSYFIGHVIDEQTPKLTMVHSLRGCALFLASGVCSIVSYFERDQHVNVWDEQALSALLATGILSILIAAMQGLDVFFATRLWRTPGSPTPTWALR